MQRDDWRVTQSSEEVPPATVAVLADLGAFFAIQSRSPDGHWQPVSTLLTGATLADHVARVQGFLADRAGAPVETRVAASIASLGLFARLMAPYVGAAVARVPLPTPNPDALSFQAMLSQPWPLHLSGALAPADPERALAVLVQPLIQRIGDEFSLSPIVLRGNLASGVFGSLGMIASTRPDLAAPAHELGARLLKGSLASTGTASGPRFKRSSCCLFYRIPGGGYCGDCVLTSARPGSSRRGRKPTI